MTKPRRKTSRPRPRFSPQRLTVSHGNEQRRTPSSRRTEMEPSGSVALEERPQPETELWFGEVVTRSVFMNGVFITKIICDGMPCKLLISGPDLGHPGDEVELQVMDDDIIGARIAGRRTFYKATATTTR